MKLSIKVEWWGILALLMSWHLGNSFGWVVFHTMLGWQYLLYAVLTVMTGMSWGFAVLFVWVVTIICRKPECIAEKGV